MFRCMIYTQKGFHVRHTVSTFVCVSYHRALFQSSIEYFVRETFNNGHIIYVYASTYPHTHTPIHRYIPKPEPTAHKNMKINRNLAKLMIPNRLDGHRMNHSIQYILMLFDYQIKHSNVDLLRECSTMKIH